MNFKVYIIRSLNTGKYYKGFSTDSNRRLNEHNEKKYEFTKRFAPWELVYIETFHNKSDALVREIKLKKYSRAQVELLILSPKNEI